MSESFELYSILVVVTVVIGLSVLFLLPFI